MHHISEQIDLLITQLAGDADNAPEIQRAQELMIEVKQLLKDYSDRLRNTPYASYSKSHTRRIMKRILIDRLSRYDE